MSSVADGMKMTGQRKKGKQFGTLDHIYVLSLALDK